MLGALAGAGAPRKNAESTRDLMVDEHMSCESDVSALTVGFPVDACMS